MNTLNQIDFLRQVHFRSIGISILSSRQPFRSNKVDRDVKLAKKENAEIDSYIHLYAMKEYSDYYANIGQGELPF
jgi:hypothetical protein